MKVGNHEFHFCVPRFLFESVHTRIFLVRFCKIMMGNDISMTKLRLVSGFVGFHWCRLETVSHGSRLGVVRALWLILLMGFDLIMWCREFWYFGVVCGLILGRLWCLLWLFNVATTQGVRFAGLLVLR